MSLQRLLGSDETVKPSQRPYAPTKRVSPPSSVLVPISRVELAQCQTALNPLRTRPAPQQQSSSRLSSLPPAPASLPARPPAATNGGLPPPPSIGHKRPNRENGPDEHVAKRWRTAPDVRSVAEHYNARPNTDRVARQDSPIIGLKSFNNWIKTVLIAKFARREDEVGPKVKVLDLGCGKGGDLQKWAKAGTDELVGLDIAEVSVEQARSRWQSLRTRFPASFYALDCFESSIEEVLPASAVTRPFDVVSMQFCMHYAFESEAKVRRMLENVSMYLKPGGVFIGTIPDEKQLFEHLDNAPDPENPLVFGNSVYSVKFDQREWDSPYGHRYTFFLQDAVEEVPEYVVYWDNFVSVAAEYGLELRFQADFQTIFSEEQEDPHFSQLLRKMRVMDAEGNAEMDEDQLDAAMLYLGFAFTRTG
ncbi:mRNA cap guanine-N7 methyltransferase [Rhodotorula toruloides]|uniref:mRNA cap guanine-N(7) methyltransferase n=1 Tax=Rhodotorula toruloides TaxID=5286 RepID=A0A0K3CKS6_RHOTO|nr:mRNA cap guanine-N7 methyltransferase [Rhodotorula toruloides]PRQ73579.1 mRNA capping enzyme-domain containing protein [Rhodotorula toruloides]